MLSSLYKLFIKAPLPNCAIGFTDDSIHLLQLGRGRSGFKIDREATAYFSSVDLSPSFSGSNISSPEGLAEIIRAATLKAGLAGQRRWSVVLPERTARSLMVHFDAPPQSRLELEESIHWRVEKLTGLSPSSLRISCQKVASGEHPRYLVTLVENGVMQEYEAVFKLLGWDAGLILPRHLGESIWLFPDRTDDRLLVSHHSGGFVAIAMKRNEMVLLRVQECGAESRENDVYRTAAYYSEKILSDKAKVWIIGSESECELTERAFQEACAGETVEFVRPSRLPLDWGIRQLDFERLAAPAALASLAYT